MASVVWDQVEPEDTSGSLVVSTTIGKAFITAEQIFDKVNGTLTAVKIVGSDKSNCEAALTTLKHSFGDPDGIVLRSADGKSLECVWTFPFRSWNTGLEHYVGEQRIRKICKKHLLSEAECQALLGLLLTLEAWRGSVPNSFLPRLLEAHIINPSIRATRVVDCALAIKRHAGA